MNSHLLRLLITCFSLALLSACADKESSYTDDAKNQYEAAKDLVAKGRYNQAAFNLEKFSSNFPYSNYAPEGELLRIFASYKGKEYALSETLSKGFIDRRPGHENVDYAKYMLAMTYYNQRGSSQHDPNNNKKAIDAFLRLLKEHPNSEYAKNGETRLQSLYNSLAKHELIVGQYYFERDRYVAAANRFQLIAKTYQTSPSIEEALYYLALSYSRMGLAKDASQTAILLNHNYPNSSWSEKIRQLQ